MTKAADGATEQMGMVERVARALCVARGGYPDDTAKVDPRGAVSPMPPGWRAWHDHVKDARAAITAMRGPTEAMLDAYYEGCDLGGDLVGTGGDLVEQAFNRMIDAALAEDTTR